MEVVEEMVTSDWILNISWRQSWEYLVKDSIVGMEAKVVNLHWCLWKLYAINLEWCSPNPYQTFVLRCILSLVCFSFTDLDSYFYLHHFHFTFISIFWGSQVQRTKVIRCLCFWDIVTTKAGKPCFTSLNFPSVF